MFSHARKMLKDTVLSFIDDEALSKGAAIAFYTVTSIGPVLLIVVAITGLAFGHDAAQNAISTQLNGLMGQQTAEVIQTAIASAAGKSSGTVATIIGIATLIATTTGVFGEMQSALNSIWKAKSRRHHRITTDSGPRCEPGISRSLRIFAHRLVGGQRGSYSIRQLFGLYRSDRKINLPIIKLCRVTSASRGPFCRHLQGSP